jgi:hypothetical protein
VGLKRFCMFWGRLVMVLLLLMCRGWLQQLVVWCGGATVCRC